MTQSQDSHTGGSASGRQDSMQMSHIEISPLNQALRRRYVNIDDLLVVKDSTDNDEEEWVDEDEGIDDRDWANDLVQSRPLLAHQQKRKNIAQLCTVMGW
ncbi:hypothetical protein GSI_14995 [Ganoderma sinense ZZ0214-1]|uniref:Uncharacterized protein n=1 Tax=Ganoderma sinense ZZ0214-1 TaxID=1077348 RepID=A0A2G8RLA7_9APHY|nr:hypothetical protein GSI_14995 [Ganoderma sinense ZZ0214-1]